VLLYPIDYVATGHACVPVKYVYQQIVIVCQEPGAVRPRSNWLEQCQVTQARRAYVCVPTYLTYLKPTYPAYPAYRFRLPTLRRTLRRTFTGKPTSG
jgi:hypothetical protein